MLNTLCLSAKTFAGIKVNNKRGVANTTSHKNKTMIKIIEAKLDKIKAGDFRIEDTLKTQFVRGYAIGVKEHIEAVSGYKMKETEVKKLIEKASNKYEQCKNM
jgi:hypothetical protein